LWTIEGGEPAMSQDRSPTVSFALPGTYRVSLAVAGATGQASAIADVRVLPAGVGAPCTEDGQCQAGMSCLHSAVDGGVWPGALAGGLCAAKCDGSSCAGGQACVDLSRSAATQAEPDAWRVPLCLPTCSADSDCRAGFACRELPVLDPGASQGGAFSFRKACFARVLGDVGAACADADGKADGAQCITGACASFGARDICTSPCTSSACPSSAVCATFTGDATHPTCIARCDVSHPCTDPLLDCQTASAMGALGFSVPTGEPANATFCAPKRCMVAIDCAPAGKCVAQAGASFCQP
jgi:PKD repeat protein